MYFLVSSISLCIVGAILSRSKANPILLHGTNQEDNYISSEPLTLTESLSPLSSIATFEPSNCHPIPSNTSAQYIIGYGSLILEASKKLTDPQAGPNFPVIVMNYDRSWNIRPPTSNITVLGSILSTRSSLDGVMVAYRLRGGNPAQSLQKYDKREELYCREEVGLDKVGLLRLQPSGKWDKDTVEEYKILVKSLNNYSYDYGQSFPQFWIYVNKPSSYSPPSKEVPIIQSYVDVFLTGCLEIEDKFDLKGYAENCVRSTHLWGGLGMETWCDDRGSPRYPRAISNVRIEVIDGLLKKLLPREFSLRSTC